MGFLSIMAGLIAAAVTIPSLVLLYFLKLRRRELTISSTLLWQRAVQDLEVNAPFQKLKRNLLLLLQLLLLLLLLFMIARPYIMGSAVEGSRLIVLIDRSGSMTATDTSPNRLVAAKQQARNIVEQAEDGSNIMVVTFASQARVVQSFTSDKQAALRAIENIQPTHQASRIGEALRLIDPFAKEVAAGKDLSVYIFSDGQVNDDESLTLSDGELRFVRIGKTAIEQPTDNLAIVGLSARRDFEQPQKVQVFLRVANFGTEQVASNFELSINGVPTAPASLVVPGVNVKNEPGITGLTIPLVLPQGATIKARLLNNDSLLADNEAAVRLTPPRQLRVLLVTQGNGFMHGILNMMDLRQLTEMTPEQYENQSEVALVRSLETDEGYDVIVFDNYAPKEIPPVNSLFFGDAPKVGEAEIVNRSEETEAILDWRKDHPVMNEVALDNILIQDAGRITLPLNAVMLAVSERGPVMAMVPHDGKQYLMVSFSSLNSNLPGEVAFPVFMKNGMTVLGLGASGSAGRSYLTGDTAVVPVLGAIEQVRYTGPEPLNSTVERQTAVLPTFERAGVYEVETKNAVGPGYETLAVNLTDIHESDTRAVEQINIGATPVQAEGEGLEVQQEVWWWFAVAAVVMLMAEWSFYTLRMHL